MIHWIPAVSRRPPPISGGFPPIFPHSVCDVTATDNSHSRHTGRTAACAMKSVSFSRRASRAAAQSRAQDTAASPGGPAASVRKGAAACGSDEARAAVGPEARQTEAGDGDGRVGVGAVAATSPPAAADAGGGGAAATAGGGTGGDHQTVHGGAAATAGPGFVARPVQRPRSRANVRVVVRATSAAAAVEAEPDTARSASAAAVAPAAAPAVTAAAVAPQAAVAPPTAAIAPKATPSKSGAPRRHAQPSTAPSPARSGCAPGGVSDPRTSGAHDAAKYEPNPAPAPAPAPYWREQGRGTSRRKLRGFSDWRLPPRYTLHNMLGYGSFGVVASAMDSVTGTKVRGCRRT